MSKIKYKGQTFSVSRQSALRIWGWRTLLDIKRTKRLIWRMGKNSLLSIFTLFLWGIYLGTTYLVGKSTHMFCGSFYQYLWESRTALFTSVILVWILAIWNGEKSHHICLLKQHSLYSEALYNFQNLIECCWKSLQISIEPPRSFLYTQDRSHMAWEYLTHVKRPINFSRSIADDTINQMQWHIHICRLTIEHLKVALEHGEIIGSHPSDSLDAIFEITSLLDRLEKVHPDTFENLQSTVIELLNNSHRLIADCRRPWRWDENTDYNILKILRAENPAYVSEENEYYWSLFFVDSSFASVDTFLK